MARFSISRPIRLSSLWPVFALLFLLCVPGLALAGTYQSDFYVYPVTDSEDEMRLLHSRVQSYRTEKDGHYFFLPSGWDRTPLAIHFPKEQTLYVDGKPVTADQPTDVLKPDTTVLFQNEKGATSYRVTVMAGTGIPALFVCTETGNMNALDRSKANLETGDMLLYGADGQLENDELISEIRGRGNSTYNVHFPKRAYQMRLQQSTNLCGMGKGKTYNLMADYLDISLLRNRISMDMAKQVGIPYGLDSQSVNMYFNGRYNGVYLLTEKVGIGESRLDIYDLEKATLKANGGELGNIESSKSEGPNREWYYSYDIVEDPPNITGGYVLELEAPIRFTKPDNGVRTSNGACLVVKEPTQVSLAQARFICDLFEKFHRAILSKDGVDPISGGKYDEFMDTDSMALVLILEEFCKNYDHEQCSLFFFKDVDSVSQKVFAGPVWDFDRTYGNVATGRWLNSPNSMLFEKNDKQHYLYSNVLRQPDFFARVKELYEERYLPAIALLLGERERQPGEALRSLKDYRAEIEPSVRMNFTYWNSFAILGIVKYSGQTFAASYDYLERFIRLRRDTVNKNWLK